MAVAFNEDMLDIPNWMVILVIVQIDRLIRMVLDEILEER